MKDIIFINPPNHAIVPNIPLGIHYLHEILKSENISSQIVDIQHMIYSGELEYSSGFFKNIKTILQQNPSHIYAFSIMNTAYPWVIEIAKIIKLLYPEAHVITGGPHVTLIKDKILEENSAITVAAIFEGEKIIFPLVSHLLKGEIDNLIEVPNLYFRNSDNKIIYTGITDMLKDLDELPLIEYDETIYDNLDVVNLDVGRGCAFNCYFCSTNYVWKRNPRFKSARKIIDEAEHYFSKIKTARKPIISFEHDNFLVKKNLLENINKIRQAEEIDFAWGCSSRIDLLNDELIDLLHSSNCAYIFFGIETGSQRMQKICRKNIKLEKVIPIIKKLTDLGIYVDANFIAGFPEETLDEFFQTCLMMAEIRWANGNIGTSVMSPEPESDIFKNTITDNYVIREYDNFYIDAKKCGISPESLEKTSNNHFYTIKNPNYNIKEVDGFMITHGKVLKFMPLSIFIALKVFNVDFFQVFEQYKSLINDQASPYLNIDQIISLFFTILTPYFNEKDGIYEELYRYEAIIARALNKMKQPKDINMQFSYNIQSIYMSLAQNPYLIFDEKYNFDKKNLVIKL